MERQALLIHTPSHFAMKRSAFTLIELLVVIVVVALLAALLLPAINRSRETARRTQCISRQRDLAFAMIAYDKANNGLPGYLNTLGQMPSHSWAIAVFPMLGENKRYEVLMGGLFPAEALVSPPALVCPSDNPGETGRLNYVVNCGPAEENGINGDIAPYFTLFKDRRTEWVAINKKVKIEDIPDGAGNTILLSENLDAGVWFKDWLICDELITKTGEFTRDSDAVRNLGFIWSPDRKFAPNALITDDPRRPSSKHPGTVIAAFADGSAKPISDDIGMGDWLKFVCPDNEKARKPVDDRDGGSGF